MWGYWWGYTCAQLELMMIDQPLIVYNKDKKKKRERPKGSNGMREFEKPSAVKAAEAQLAWEQKYKNGMSVNVGKFNFGK